MKIQIAAILSLSGSTMAFTTAPSASKFTTTLSATNGDDMNVECSRRQSFATILSTAVAFGAAAPALAVSREPRAEYLTEPTEAFKESEKQRDEFRRAQLALKKKFNIVLERFTVESKTEEAFVVDLKELKELVITTEGLPSGIKKDELVKIIRAKKSKGYWPTDVEYAYQSLIREIAYQQSPNRDKDISNPL